METKKVKLIAVLGIMLLSMLVFNINTVNAFTEIGVSIDKGKITEEIFNEVVPDTMELDMKAGNFNKFENQIMNKIIENLKTKGILVSKTDNFDTFFNFLWENQSADKNNAVQIGYCFKDSSYFKAISIKWSNKIEKNESDKQKLEQLLKNLGFVKNDRRKLYL